MEEEYIECGNCKNRIDVEMYEPGDKNIKCGQCGALLFKVNKEQMEKLEESLRENTDPMLIID